MNILTPNPQLFEAVFKHATLGILITDARGEIRMANRFSLNEFGYSEEELIGKRIETLIPKRFHPQHTAERNHYLKFPETRPMGAGRDLFGLRKDGSEFPVEVSLSPFTSANENFVIAFLIDISARKEKEADEKEYQRKIAEISISLKKEKEINDMKSNFLTLASHEFKTPLSTILSSASLLSKYTAAADQSVRNKHIERIKSCVLNLNNILNEFLSISHIEAGEINVHSSEFDLEKFITNICQETQDAIQSQHRIQYNHYGETSAWSDTQLLRNILNNLLSNAIKFSPKGEIVLVESRSTPQEIVIRITDHGCGISKEDQVHLFERFFRATNASNIPGTGLGLHIVRQYAALLKGEIQLKSELNKGTEITLILKK